MKPNAGKLVLVLALAVAMPAMVAANALAQGTSESNVRTAEAYYSKYKAEADAAEAKHGVHSAVWAQIDGNLNAALSQLSAQPPQYADHREDARRAIIHAMAEVQLCRKMDAERKK
jgi:hypothetical protein